MAQARIGAATVELLSEHGVAIGVLDLRSTVPTIGSYLALADLRDSNTAAGAVSEL